MTGGHVRDKLTRIAAQPASEWATRLGDEFPDDPALRMQGLLWLHAEKASPDLGGSPPSLGDDADERYELAIRLDTGATASVWQAFDRRLGRHVAIKVFRDHEQSEVLDQVVAEARAASDVVSEHVVRVLDVQYGSGQPYIVMELVGEYDPDKGELSLGRDASSLRPANIEEAVRWVMQIARGVHEAHLRNVFHRDLKPKNVLITPNSRHARVTDFGLAVSGVTPDGTHPSITLLKRGPSGPVSVRGTPEYMAPEQARGLPLSLDARSADDRRVLVAVDVWGLGAIAYELLTGRPPWLARQQDDLSAWEVAASSRRSPALKRTRDGERIPAPLRRVIEKAMAIDPKARYASAAAVANELGAFLAKRPTTLDRSHALRFALWCRRNPQLALAALVATVLAALVVVTRTTVVRLRADRRALDHEVTAQKAEQTRLNAILGESRDDLAVTQRKLAEERQNLTNLEKSIAEDRSSYETLLEAKEQALRSANLTTRKIIDQLDAATRDKRDAQQARVKLEKLVGDLRRDLDKLDKDRDRIRRERDAVRVERDVAQRERDRATAERDAATAARESADKQLNDMRAQLERVPAPVRKAKPSGGLHP
jgi:serine/threonine protein kinase